MRKLAIGAIIIALGALLAFSQSSKTKDDTKKQTTSAMQTQKVLLSTTTQTDTKNTEQSTVISDADIDEEKAEVLIDWGMSKGFSYTEGQDEEGIPYSFGTFKGIFNLEGKSLLVFEGDDGTLSFIQIFRQGKSIKWKVYLQIRRSL